MKALEQSEYVKLADQPILVVIEDIKGDSHESLGFVIVDQLFDQFYVAVEVLCVVKLWEFLDDPLCNGSFVPSAYGSPEIALGQLSPDNLRCLLGLV